jgi:hypothetical protein
MVSTFSADALVHLGRGIVADKRQQEADELRRLQLELAKAQLKAAAEQPDPAAAGGSVFGLDDPAAGAASWRAGRTEERMLALGEGKPEARGWDSPLIAAAIGRCESSVRSCRIWTEWRAARDDRRRWVTKQLEEK